MKSPAGSILLTVIHSLLLLPVAKISTLLDPLHSLLDSLSSVNRCIMRHCMTASSSERLNDIHNATSVTERYCDSMLFIFADNIWLLDIEKCCSFVIGRILGHMLLVNVRHSADDITCLPLKSLSILKHGLELKDSPENLGKCVQH